MCDNPMLESNFWERTHLEGGPLPEDYEPEYYELEEWDDREDEYRGRTAATENRNG